MSLLRLARSKSAAASMASVVPHQSSAGLPQSLSPLAVGQLLELVLSVTMRVGP